MVIFVDNDAARYGLIKGDSPSRTSGRLLPSTGEGTCRQVVTRGSNGLPVRATWQMGQPGWSSTARRAGSMSLTLRFLGKSSARDGRIWECKESSRQAQLSGPFTFAQRNAHAAKGGAHRSSARTALRSTC